MRYLLDHRLRNELADRQRFLYDVFHIYTSVTSHKDYLELVSVPKEEINICLLLDIILLPKRYYNKKNLKKKT